MYDRVCFIVILKLLQDNFRHTQDIDNNWRTIKNILPIIICTSSVVRLLNALIIIAYGQSKECSRIEEMIDKLKNKIISKIQSCIRTRLISI